jgi:hypothetical protein
MKAVVLKNFLESLRVMGLGMLGIFSVAILIMIVMYALTRLFPGDKDAKKDE